MALLDKDKFSENLRESVKNVKMNQIEKEDDFLSLKNRMKRKIKEYFQLNKFINYEKFDEFMDYLDLKQIFSTDQIVEIWAIFSEIAQDRENLDMEEATKGVMELLNYYYSDTQEVNSIVDNSEFSETEEMNSPSHNFQNKNPKNNIDLYQIDPNYEIKLDNSNPESLKNNNDNNFNNIVNSEEFKNIIHKRNNSGIAVNNNSGKPTRPKHERKITKIFKEIDIETLMQLRRVFSLLDIKNKQVLYIRELSDILKYKFINLTYEQLLDFLQNLSYDSDITKINNFDKIQKQGKISINFELYSRAISAIEQKIINENFDEFSEPLNESEEIKENFPEVFESLNKFEFEAKDYISVLADIFISMRQKYENDTSEINTNIDYLNKINASLDKDSLVKTNEMNSTIKNLKIQFSEYFKIFANKTDDIEIFLKDLNNTNIQLSKKINLLKLISEKYDSNYKNLEIDYYSIVEKYNTSQPVEISDETEQLLDENAYLKDDLENKNNIIDSFKQDLKSKEDKIFHLNMDIEKMRKNNNDIENNYVHYKRSFEEMEKNYDTLRNEIYEKIIREEQEENNNNNENKDKDKNKNIEKPNYRQSVLLKEKFLREDSENAKKILEMDYEKLVLYCLEIEKINNNHNKILTEKEGKIKKLEQDIENLNNLIQENSRQIYLLNAENSRLNSRINDILRENEFNKSFRPSIALNNRMSRTSSVFRGSTSQFNNNNNLFQSSKNSFFAFNKNKINNIINSQDENNMSKIQNEFISEKKNTEKNSLFDVYKGNNENNQIEQNLSDKTLNNKTEIITNLNDIRLSNLEIEEIQEINNKINLNENQEDDINKFNQEIFKQIENRELTKSASNFQIKYEANDFKNTKQDFKIRNTNNDYNPFIFDDDDNGFVIKNKQSAIKDEEDKINNIINVNNINQNNLKGNNDEKNSKNNNLQNQEIFKERNSDNIHIKNNPPPDSPIEEFNQRDYFNSANIPVNYNSEEHFKFSTWRNTNISNNQGIINEISRASSFNFDTDVINNNEWDTTEILNDKRYESTNQMDDNNNTCNNYERGKDEKYDLDFSYKKNEESENHVHQIIDDIEQFDDMPENNNEKNNLFEIIPKPEDIKRNSKIINKNLLENNNHFNPFNDNSDLNRDSGNQVKNNNLNNSETTEFKRSNNFDSSNNSDLGNKIQDNFFTKKNIEQIKINKGNTQNLKVEQEKKSSTSGLINNINNSLDAKKNEGLNSKKKIADKILEEDDLEEDGDEQKDKVIPIEKVSLGNNSLKNLGSIPNAHVRNATVDLDKEFTKPSEYMCYDFLTLRKNVAIVNMIDKYNEGVSSYEMFSENIHYFDDQKKKTKRYLFITCNSIYILRPYDISEKVRIPLKDLVFHFAKSDDMMLEILRRMELLYYFRDLYKIKSFGKLKLRYSDNFKIKQGGVLKSIIIDQSNNLFIAPNFENAQKLAYIEKLCGGFFQRFKEKLVVLTNIGLMYFNDPKDPPRKLIPIIGSEIKQIDEKKHGKKYCFEIKTLNNELYVFAVKTKDDMDSWFNQFKLFKINYHKMMKNVDTKKEK